MFKPRLWTLWNTFPMVTAGSRPADPELPWGAGRPPGEGRAADGISSPWRWLAAARPARSSPGELGGHQGRGEQTDLPSSPWRRPAAARPAWSSPGELGGRQGRGEQPTVPIFPLEVAGSRQGGPEQPGEYGGPCGSWWPPGEERAASRAKVLRFLPMGSVGQENS